MRIKEVHAQAIKNSLSQDTIEVFVKTDKGRFLASAPGGVSRGSFETPAFIADAKNTIHLFNKNVQKIIETEINEIIDLHFVEKIIDKRKFGANTLFALEAAILKALAREKEKEVWQIFKPNGRRMPRPIGNVIGGGKHSTSKLKPSIQEFLVIPKTKSFKLAVETMKEVHKRTGHIIKVKEKNFFLKKDAESAWQTKLKNEEALNVISAVNEVMESQRRIHIDMGIDIAASHSKKISITAILKIVENFNIFYIEDPLFENDFSNWKKLNATLKEKHCLLVADDLTATNLERLKKAIKMKACNAVIVKPNQNGSLLETIEFVNLAKKHNIFTIVSHRAGETMDDFIADFAFGIQADFIKTGVIGKEREVKLKRLVDIERESD